MGNNKKYIWKDYFESRSCGDYSKAHKDILRIVDKRLRKALPKDYPNIYFNWADISELYDECRDEYYGQEKSESKQTMVDVLDADVMFSYPGAEIIFDIDRSSCYPSFSAPILYSPIELDLIQWNKDKDCVFVKLMDGRSTVVKRYGDTKDDIYAAVAYALAKIEFETNSNFKKEVDSCLVILDSKKGKKGKKDKKNSNKDVIYASELEKFKDIYDELDKDDWHYESLDEEDIKEDIKEDMNDGK